MAHAPRPRTRPVVTVTVAPILGAPPVPATPADRPYPVTYPGRNR